MSQESHLKYPWPASALAPADMNLLYRARELSPERQTITHLLAHAVRKTFGHLAETAPTDKLPEERKEAA
jgi:hypothetical protein